MKKLTLIFSIIFVLTFTGCKNTYADTSDDYDNITIYSEQEIIEFNCKLSEAEIRKEMAHQIAENARYFGYDNESNLIIAAREEWIKANKDYDTYSDLVSEAKWSRPMKEYPAATVIWITLKEEGFSDEVIAGIIGNLMAEVGGQTLNLNYTNETKNYYGMCQWNKKTYKKVIGQDLQGQINFLINSMEDEFNTFGYCYRDNFNFNSFLNLSNEQDVAIAFATCYERCGSSSHKTRANNASIAYEYFTNI